MSSPRVLILGPGLLGLGLHSRFLQEGVTTKITIRSKTSDKNPVIVGQKAQLTNILLKEYNGSICDTLDDYKKVIEEYKPTHIIDTIPETTNISFSVI